MIIVKVVDNITHEPVGGANVKLDGVTVQTDPTGNAPFADSTSPTTAVIEVSHAAYKTVKVPLLEYGAGAAIALQRSGDLPEVVVTPQNRKALTWLLIAAGAYWVLHDQKMI